MEKENSPSQKSDEVKGTLGEVHQLMNVNFFYRMLPHGNVVYFNDYDDDDDERGKNVEKFPSQLTRKSSKRF